MKYMSLCLVFAALLACLAVPFASANAEPINGAFGVELGSRFNLARSTSVGMSSDETWIEFRVDRPLPVLSRFRALVTPLGYLVYALLAEDPLSDTESCLEYARALARTIAEKYLDGVPGTTMHVADDRRLYLLTQISPARRISVACDIAGNLTVLYVDLALRQQAAAEQVTWNRLMTEFNAGRYESAVGSLRELADNGHVHAQYFTGLAYRRGLGVAADDVRARTYYLKAARAGLLDAQFNLGTFLFVRGEYAEALPWLRAAAERGMAAAQNNLAQLYLHEGSLSDEAEAFRWFLRAAEGGHIEAQYNTCHMYSAGDGVPRSEVDAYRWCDIAAARGHQKARENRDFIAKRMQPAQIERARMQSQEWQAAHPPH